MLLAEPPLRRLVGEEGYAASAGGHRAIPAGERPNDRGLVTIGGTVTVHLTRCDRSEVVFIQDPTLNLLLAAGK
jgi:hypothetical protein